MLRRMAPAAFSMMRSDVLANMIDHLSAASPDEIRQASQPGWRTDRAGRLHGPVHSYGRFQRPGP